MADSLTWSGTNGNLWDKNSTVNWDNAGTPNVFFDGDSVTFNDAATNGNVVLSGTLQPASITIDNGATAYDFSGPGRISGVTSLLKSGTGTLTISTNNVYTGGTVISAGTIIAADANALSNTGTITLGNAGTGTNHTAFLSSVTSFARPIVVSNQGTGAATIGRAGASSVVTISSLVTLNRDANFQSAASGTLSLTGTLRGTGNATFNGGGVTSLGINSGTGGLAWTGNVAVAGNSVVVASGSNHVFVTGSARSLDVAAGSGVALTSGTLRALTGGGIVGSSTNTLNLSVGAVNTSSTFGGVIGSGTVAGYSIGAAANLTKIGTGTLTLTGNNTYTGTTRVSQGTLALAGAGSIANSSSIAVTSGAILDVSALSSGTFTLGNAQTLQAGRTSAFANDIIGNLASSGTINVAGSGTAGRLTISNDLALNGGTLRFDLAGVPTPGTSDLITLGGQLSLSGTTYISANLLSGSLANGTYTLISGGTGLGSGDASNLAWGGTLHRQNIIFDTTSDPGSVFMNVTGVVANLVWSGTNGNNWNTGSTVNWSNSGSPDVFLGGDSVTFNDAATNGNVVLSGTLQPASVVVDNADTSYELSGAGRIAGTSSLLKSGTGTLTISTDNSYTGGTVISAGTVIAAHANALSNSGTITLGDANTGASKTALLSSVPTFARPIVVSDQGTGTVTIGRSGTHSLVTIDSLVTLNRDATFLSAASGTLSLTGTLRGAGNATFDGGGVTSLASFSGTAATAWTGNAAVMGNSMLVTSGSNHVFVTGSARSLNVTAGSGAALNTTGTLRALTGGGTVGSNTGTLNLAVGAANTSSTFSGVIGGGTVAGYSFGSSVNLTKIGTGTLTLAGNNTYTGTTRVSQGTLALAGAGSIGNSSSIMVASGALLDVSALSSGTLALGGSQTLQAGRTSGFGNDIIGNVASSGLINIAGSGTAGTLTLGNNLALNGGSLQFDLANVTTPGANDLITLGGQLSLSGTTYISAHLLNGTLANGTYTLISGGTGLGGGSSSNLAWGGTLYRQSIAFDVTSTPGSVFMNVSGSAAHLIWSGTNGNNWNTNSTVNWDNSGTPDVFMPGDSVTFNDSASNGNVVLSGTLQPTSVTVDNGATAYDLSGAGRIAGVGGLLKSGTGTLTISTDNSYTGGTVISAGTVIAAHANALSNTGTVTLGDANTGANNVALLSSVPTFARPIVVSDQGTGTVTVGRSGTHSLVTIDSLVTLNRDATFLSAASGTLSLTGALRGTGDATFDGGGVTSLAISSASAWTGDVLVRGNSMLVVSGSSHPFVSGSARNLDVAAGSGVALTSGTLRTLTGGGHVGSSGSTANLAVGSGNASSTFNGVIGGGAVAGYSFGSSVNLNKIGSGTLTLAGNNTYTGTTRVSQGTLALAGAGSIGSSSSIAVSSGAILDVSALSSGTFTLGNAQTLQAGRTSGFANDIIGNVASSGAINIAGSGTSGSLTISNNLALNGGTLQMDLANVFTPGAGVNDLITIGGSLSLSGTTFIAPNLLHGSLSDGTYTLVSGGTGLSSGGSSNVAWGGPVLRQTISFDTTTTPGAVLMNVSGSAASLVWSGSGGNVWNANSSTNWSSSGTSEQFYATDKVTFTDTAATGTVVLSGTLLPASMIVNNGTTAYVLSGSGQLAGSGNLVKSGTGTLTIQTENTFTGGTVINDGTIIIADVGSDASVLSTGDVTVEDEGVLSGAGTVLGDTTVSGTLAPGNSPGEIHFAGDLTLGDEAVVKMEIASSSLHDVLDVDGLLTYGGTLQITFLDGFVPTVGQTFQLFDASNVVSGSEFDDIVVSGFEGVFNYGTGQITFGVIPEPGTFGLVVMSLLWLRARRRRG